MKIFISALVLYNISKLRLSKLWHFQSVSFNMNEGISLLCRHSNANVTIETIMIIAIVASTLKQC